VTDAWLVYNALLGIPTPPPLAMTPLEGLQLALLRQYFCDLLDDEVRKLFEEALAALRSANARIVEAEIAHAAEIAPAYAHVSLAEAATYHAKTLDEKPELYTQSVRLRLETGRYILAEDYVRASLGREVLRREVDRALEGCQALLLPTLPIPAPPIGAATVRIGSVDESVRAAMLRLTQLFNMTGHPAVSIPCGTTAAGLPCGLQLVGRRTETAALVRVALACERALAEPVERS
jgi:aspartyl-tRNA(Asn)/glutamyl-tRNA(Gln) amidotransferase subunit A